jgi:hypothetical protein
VKAGRDPRSLEGPTIPAPSGALAAGVAAGAAAVRLGPARCVRSGVSLPPEELELEELRGMGTPDDRPDGEPVGRAPD